MNLVYRKCTLSDLEELRSISIATFIHAFAKDNKPEDFENYLDDAFSSTAMHEQLTNPNSTFYFVYLKQELVGYFKLNIGEAQNEVFQEETMELERIYVLPEHIGKGIGERVLQHICEMAKLKKTTFLWLGVWERNEAAIRFYERHGFEKFSTHPYYVGKDKQTDWLMKLTF